MILAIMIALAAGLLVGMTYAAWAKETSLTIGVDDGRRGAQKIAGRFYYVVPESEYVARFTSSYETNS